MDIPTLLASIDSSREFPVFFRFSGVFAVLASMSIILLFAGSVVLLASRVAGRFPNSGGVGHGVAVLLSSTLISDSLLL